jgi:hypothetical protein|tara:strand:+ start:113 stop:382 length:270 start_codon:yes stop_codon:yes gene_type:complete
MKVADLKPGMLLRPKKGFEWRLQKSVYLDKMMCLTVERCVGRICQDNVVIYVGERELDDMSYGKQIVLWKGKKISVNPSSWRSIEGVEE